MTNHNNAPVSVESSQASLDGETGIFPLLPEVAAHESEIVTPAAGEDDNSVAEASEATEKWKNPKKRRPVLGAIAGGGNYAFAGWMLANNTNSLLSKTAVASGIGHPPNTWLPVGELWRFATTNFNAFQRTVGEVASHEEGQYNASMIIGSAAIIGLGTAVRSWRRRKDRLAEVLPAEIVSETDNSTLQ